MPIWNAARVAQLPTAFGVARQTNLRNTQHSIVGGGGHLVIGANMHFWSGEHVFSSGKLVTRPTPQLSSGDRTRLHKHRCYQMTTDQAARDVIGYLMVRGGAHQAAYALALRRVTGVEVPKMLPTPNIDDARLPEARKWRASGSHRKLYTFSETDDADVAGIWSGPADWEEVYKIAAKLMQKGGISPCIPAVSCTLASREVHRTVPAYPRRRAV